MKEDRDALTNKLDDQTVTLASFQTDAKILAEKNAQLTTQLVDTQGNLSQFRKHNGILEVELANRTASVNGELKELEQLNIALARHKASDVDAAVREAKLVEENGRAISEISDHRTAWLQLTAERDAQTAKETRLQENLAANHHKLVLADASSKAERESALNVRIFL